MNGWGRYAIGLTLLLALGLAGCSPGARMSDPVSPAAIGGEIELPLPPATPPAGSEGPDTLSTSSHVGRHGSSGPSNDRPATVAFPITGAVEIDGAVIGPKGGTVKAGNFELDIPEGALESPVAITVSDLSGVTGRVECELLPHGLQFNTPVELAVKLPEGVKVEFLTLFWVVNEGLPTEIWAPMPTRVESGGGRIVAELTHFSRYAPGQTDGKAGWQKLPGRGAQNIGHAGE